MYTGADARTGNPRQVSRTFRGTRRQADTALSNFLTEVVKGHVPVAASATLAEYLSQLAGPHHADPFDNHRSRLPIQDQAHQRQAGQYPSGPLTAHTSTAPTGSGSTKAFTSAASTTSTRSCRRPSVRP